MEKRIFIVVFASVDLAKCHGVAISGNPVCGLYVVMEWHSHKAIDDFVEETESGYITSLFFKGLPAQLSH